MRLAPACKDVDIELLEHIHDLVDAPSTYRAAFLLFLHSNISAKKRNEGTCTDHFALLQLRNVLFEDQLSLRLDFGHLPDGMVREQAICSSKGRVVEHIWIAFEHVPNRRPGLAEASFPLFVLLCLQRIGVLSIE